MMKPQRVQTILAALFHQCHQLWTKRPANFGTLVRMLFVRPKKTPKCNTTTGRNNFWKLETEKLRLIWVEEEEVTCRNDFMHN